MTREIAVICASPPGANTGMASVDLAFRHLSVKHGFAERVRYYRLYPAAPTEANDGGYALIPERNDEWWSSRAAIVPPKPPIGASRATTSPIE